MIETELNSDVMMLMNDSQQIDEAERREILELLPNFQNKKVWVFLLLSFIAHTVLAFFSFVSRICVITIFSPCFRENKHSNLKNLKQNILAQM